MLPMMWKMGDGNLRTRPRFRIRPGGDEYLALCLFRSDRQPLPEPLHPLFDGLLLQVKGGELSRCWGLSALSWNFPGILREDACHPSSLPLLTRSILWASLFPRRVQDCCGYRVDSFRGDGFCTSNVDIETLLITKPTLNGNHPPNGHSPDINLS